MHFILCASWSISQEETIEEEKQQIATTSHANPSDILYVIYILNKTDATEWIKEGQWQSDTVRTKRAKIGLQKRTILNI